MRDACNLKEEVQKADGPGEIGCQLGDEGRMMRELDDTLAARAIEQDTEAQETPGSITSIWKLLASPHVASAPHGGDVAKEHFARMISAGLWLPRGNTYKGSRATSQSSCAMEARATFTAKNATPESLRCPKLQI